MPEGNLFVLSAPSGCGKTTLIKKLLRKGLNIQFSVSYTTRKKRQGEREGVDYYYISEKKFKEMVKKKKFLEWAKVHNFYYGTSKEKTLSKLKKGIDLILDIDTKGALTVKKNFPETILIFLFPPSYGELEKRLRKRGDLKEEEIKLRLENAKKEVLKYNNYDFYLINDKIEETLKGLIFIISAFKHRYNSMEEKIKKIIKTFKFKREV